MVRILSFRFRLGATAVFWCRFKYFALALALFEHYFLPFFSFLLASQPSTTTAPTGEHIWISWGSFLTEHDKAKNQDCVRVFAPTHKAYKGPNGFCISLKAVSRLFFPIAAFAVGTTECNFVYSCGVSLSTARGLEKWMRSFIIKQHGAAGNGKDIAWNELTLVALQPAMYAAAGVPYNLPICEAYIAHIDHSRNFALSVSYSTCASIELQRRLPIYLPTGTGTCSQHSWSHCLISKKGGETSL